MMSSLSRSLRPCNALHNVHRVYSSFLSSHDPRSPSRSPLLPRNVYVSSRTLSATRKDTPMPKESKEYWERILEIVESPAALKLKSQLDLDDVTGIPKHLKRSPPCLEFHTSIKKQFPEKIVLVQIGDFYESCGHDAVLMVSECGLNPMSLENKIPRAGCPLKMLPNILNQLVHKTNLSVVVCDEIDQPPENTKKNQQKQREVTQIYNPGEQGFDKVLENQLNSGGASSMVGLIWGPDGYGVLEFRLDRMSIEVFKSLTEDALWGLLSAKNITAPISVHHDFTQKLPDWKKFLKKIVSGVSARAHSLRAQDPVLEFRQFIKQHYGYSEEQEISIKEQDLQNRRRSPSYSTASQIGLTGLLGIPNILDFLTLKDSPVPIKAWFRDLLLSPKSLQTTASIQASLALLEVLGDSLPGLRTDMSPEKVAKALDHQTTSVEFCRSLNQLFSDVRFMFTSEALQDLTETILPIIEEEQSIQLDSHSFQNSCKKHQNRIQEIIILEPENESEEQDPRTGFRDNSPMKYLDELFKQNENFDGIIQQKYISQELSELEASKERLIHTVFDLLDSIQSLSKDFSMGPEISLVLIDKKDLLITGPPTLSKHPDFQKIGLEDRTKTIDKRKISKRIKQYSTVLLDEDLADYLRSTEKVKFQIQSILNTLGEELKRERSFLIATSQFCLTLQSLIQHSWSSQGKGWKLPNISNALTPVEDQSSCSFKVQEMWPYWMEKEAHSTVKNAVELEDMVLLTGPNMAGKSTVLRCIVSCTLLALSGLYIPAETMNCPYFDNVVLRSFSGDNPLAKQSGFSMEMNEMKTIFDQSTKHSLVLVDELGKGTEVKTGAGIAGSFLEHFAMLKCKGMFSTHLHLIKDMNLDLTHITLMKMDTKEVSIEVKKESKFSPDFKHVPEWTISNGYNPQTLAIEVAKDLGIKEEVVNQAFQFQDYLIKNKDILKNKKWSFTPIFKKQETIISLHQPLSDNGVQKSVQNGVQNDVQKSVQKSDDLVQDKVNGEVLEDDIIQILVSVCQEHGVCHSESDPIKVYHVKCGHQPPPFSSGRSCVYVNHRKSGHHYVGETDNLMRRLKYYREKKNSPEISREFVTWYVCIPKASGAKSMSRAIERGVIRRLVELGRLMESTSDLRNKSFGIRD